MQVRADQYFDILADPKYQNSNNFKGVKDLGEFDGKNVARTLTGYKSRQLTLAAKQIRLWQCS
jgi:hypothetical protein